MPRVDREPYILTKSEDEALHLSPHVDLGMLCIKPGTHLYYLAKYINKKALGASAAWGNQQTYSESQFECPINIIEGDQKRVQIGVFRTVVTSPDIIQIFTTLTMKDNFAFYKKLSEEQKQWKAYIKGRTKQTHGDWMRTLR